MVEMSTVLPRFSIRPVPPPKGTTQCRPDLRSPSAPAPRCARRAGAGRPRILQPVTPGPTNRLDRFSLGPRAGEGRGEVAGQPELEEEQAFLDRAHAGLDAMRADSQRMLESVLDLGRGGTFQSRTERDIVVRTSLARLAQLDIGDQALCFGRIDVAPERDGAEPESFHIGRLAVSDTAH